MLYLNTPDVYLQLATGSFIFKIKRVKVKYVVVTVKVSYVDFLCYLVGHHVGLTVDFLVHHQEILRKNQIHAKNDDDDDDDDDDDNNNLKRLVCHGMYETPTLISVQVSIKRPSCVRFTPNMPLFRELSHHMSL